jgi:hypothetical protein
MYAREPVTLRELIYHKHYWSIPHGRAVDNKIIQVCYDCGKERQSPINLGPPRHDASGRQFEAEPRPVETGEQRPTGAGQHGPHSDLLAGIAKLLYRKKKLVSG